MHVHLLLVLFILIADPSSSPPPSQLLPSALFCSFPSSFPFLTIVPSLSPPRLFLLPSSLSPCSSPPHSLPSDSSFFQQFPFPQHPLISVTIAGSSSLAYSIIITKRLKKKMQFLHSSHKII